MGEQQRNLWSGTTFPFVDSLSLVRGPAEPKRKFWGVGNVYFSVYVFNYEQEQVGSLGFAWEAAKLLLRPAMLHSVWTALRSALRTPCLCSTNQHSRPALALSNASYGNAYRAYRVGPTLCLALNSFNQWAPWTLGHMQTCIHTQACIQRHTTAVESLWCTAPGARTARMSMGLKRRKSRSGVLCMGVRLHSLPTNQGNASGHFRSGFTAEGS